MAGFLVSGWMAHALWLCGAGASGWSRLAPGPWGQVEYREVVLEPPAASWMQLAIDERDCWRFPGVSRPEVVARMRQMGFEGRWDESIADDRLWEEGEDGCRYHPPLEMFQELPAPQREAIYLWQLELAPREFFRFTISMERDHDELLSDLPEAWRRLVNQTGYRLGDTFCVSGLSYLDDSLGGNREDTIRLFRAMARTRSLMPRIRVDPGTDLEAVEAYWGASGRNPGGSAILRSLAPVTQPVWIDLVHLLPPVPRRYLDTFLVEHDIWLDTAPDCFWSTVNFFELTPSARALDPVSFAHYVADELEPTDQPRQFGDVVALFSEGEVFLHSYIHVAGDLVFAKNGKSPLAPWVLMREEDMLSHYRHGTYRKQAYRRLPLP